MSAGRNSANLLSLGAIDFGIIVDGAVIMAENILRHRSHAKPTGHRVVREVQHAAVEVARPLTFAVRIIMTVYVPILSFQRIEGRLFSTDGDHHLGRRRRRPHSDFDTHPSAFDVFVSATAVRTRKPASVNLGWRRRRAMTTVVASAVEGRSVRAHDSSFTCVQFSLRTGLTPCGTD